MGAGHGVDVALWWHNTDAPLSRAIDVDGMLTAVADRLATTFASFIRTGTPSDPAWHRYCIDGPREKFFGTAGDSYR